MRLKNNQQISLKLKIVIYPELCQTSKMKRYAKIVNDF